MNVVFKYKQQLFLKVWLLLIIGSFPLMIHRLELYLHPLYLSVFFLVQSIIHVYYASKRIIVTDWGIQQNIFWNMRYRTVGWDEILEAREIAGNTGSEQSPIERLSIQHWLVEKSTENTVRIIIDNEEPIVFDMKEIKDNAGLYKLLDEHIRFVRL